MDAPSEADINIDDSCDCCHLPDGSRQRQICDGDVNWPLEKINKYRVQFGVNPLPDDGEWRPSVVVHSGKTVVRKQTTSRPRRLEGGCGSCGGGKISAVNKAACGPGTELKKAWKEQGYPECDACNELAALMDQWGPSGCRDNLADIIDNIFPRAKQWLTENRPWMMSFAKAAEIIGVIDRDAEIRKQIESDVLSAIVSSEANPCPNASGRAKVKNPVPESNIKKSHKWSYGVMTVASRYDTLLPRTLESLERAGFTDPMLFVDGKIETNGQSVPMTVRGENARTAGNLILSLYEMYVKSPNATMFVLFQDDFVTYRNLFNYLKAIPYPENGYFNLHTLPQNEKYSDGKTGWYPSNQKGFGAVGLIFPRDILVKVLSSRFIIENFQNEKQGFRHIDMTISKALGDQGIKEYVHNPTLLLHTGIESSMGNSPYKPTTMFRGEDFDAMDFLRESA